MESNILDRARAAIAIICAASLMAGGILESLGLAQVPQWVIGTASGWVTTFFGITIYQTRAAARRMQSGENSI